MYPQTEQGVGCCTEPDNGPARFVITRGLVEIVEIDGAATRGRDVDILVFGVFRFLGQAETA